MENNKMTNEQILKVIGAIVALITTLLGIFRKE